MRLDLPTGTAQVFFPDHEPASGEIYWDESQSWIYYWIEARDHPQEGHVEVVSTRDPSLRRVLPDQDSVKFTLGIKFVPHLDRLYVASEKANYAYDGATLARIDSFGTEQITIHESYFLSRDGSTLFYRITDPATQQSSLTGFSLTTKLIVSRKAIAEIGPPVRTKILYGGNQGRALFGYNDPGPGSGDGTYIVYDAVLGILHPAIRIPFVSNNVQLSSDGESLIFHETPWTGDQTEASGLHQGSGRVWLFDVASGLLRQKFTFPPGGTVFVFSRFSDRFFYFNQATKQSFSVNLTIEATVHALLDSLQTALTTANLANSIGETSFVQTLSRYISNASRMLISGDTLGGSAQLETFRKQLKRAYQDRAKQSDKRWVSMDGYQELYYFSGYLLDRLRVSEN